MTATIPDSHRELFERPIHVVLTTLMPSGQPQSSVIWCDYDGEHIRINSARGRQKDKNMEADPRVTILALDPENPYFWIEVRGVVEEITEVGAVEHIDSLAKRYTGHERFFGGYSSTDQQHAQTRAIYKIKPRHVVAYGPK